MSKVLLLSDNYNTFIAETDTYIENIEDPKEGDIIPHNKRVKNIQCFMSHYDNNGLEHTQRIFMRANDIIEMADRIKAIEKETIDLPYSSLPW